MILFRQRSDVHKQQADGIMLIQPEGYRREYEDDRRNEVYRKYAARTGGAGDKIAIDGLKKLSTTTTAIVRKGIDTANVLTGTIRRGVRETTRLTTSLVPGLLSPLVVLFELPGLTEHWFVQMNPFTLLVVQSKPDPLLIVIGCSTSLFFAVLANISLLLRLLGTRDRLFTLGAIFFLSIHSILNVICLVGFAVGYRHTNDELDGFRLSTAFWLTTSSTLLAIVLSGLLICDGFRTKWYAVGGIGVTAKQRSLDVAFTIFLTVLIIGTVSFRYLIPDLNFLDSLYFVVQSVITTGFGDIVPISTAARALSIVYNAFGIISFGIVIAFTRITFLESIEALFRSREEHVLRGVRKRSLRLARTVSLGITRLGSRKERRGCWKVCELNRGQQIADLEAGSMQPTSAEQEKKDEIGASDERTRWPRSQRGQQEGDDRGADVGQEEEEEEDNDQDNYEADVIALRMETAKEVRSQILVSTFLFFFIWTMGSLVFCFLENWDYFTSFYFAFSALSTVGYGDLYPSTQAGRAFFCGWAMAGAGILTVLFTVLADAYSSTFNKTFKRSILGRLIKKLGPPSSTDSQDPRMASAIERHLHEEDIDQDEELRQQHREGSSEASYSPTHLSHKPPPGVSRSHTCRSAEDQLAYTLLALVDDMKRHLDDLMESNTNGSTAVRNEVRELMREKDFSIANWEAVESEDRLMRFLYLRRMREKLTRLNVKATTAIRKSSGAKSRSPPDSSESRVPHPFSFSISRHKAQGVEDPKVSDIGHGEQEAQDCIDIVREDEEVAAGAAE